MLTVFRYVLFAEALCRAFSLYFIAALPLPALPPKCVIDSLSLSLSLSLPVVNSSLPHSLPGFD
jgi:hypothetical protein